MGERHDHVVVGLGDGRSVSPESLTAFFVRFPDFLQYAWRFFVHPGEQRRSKIETDPGIVVDEIDNPPLIVEESRTCIRGIAFCRHAFVPVVVRVRGILQFYSFQRRIFPWGLIKMAVNANVFRHKWPLTLCSCCDLASGGFPRKTRMRRLASRDKS